MSDSVFVIMAYRAQFLEIKSKLTLPEGTKIINITEPYKLRGLRMSGFYLDDRILDRLSARDFDETKILVRHNLNR